MPILDFGTQCRPTWGQDRFQIPDLHEVALYVSYVAPPNAKPPHIDQDADANTMLDYMHPNNLGSQLGILQVQCCHTTYSGTQYKQNTDGYILRMDNTNRNDAHKLTDVLLGLYLF